MHLNLIPSLSLAPLAVMVLPPIFLVLPTGTTTGTSVVQVAVATAGVNFTSRGLLPCAAPLSPFSASITALNVAASFLAVGVVRENCTTSLSTHAGIKRGSGTLRQIATWKVQVEGLLSKSQLAS